MSSLTDELTGKALDSGKQAASASAKVIKQTAKVAKTGAEAVKGICLLLLEGGDFTTEKVMKAVKDVAFKKTGDIKFSRNNIDISKLRESGKVYQIDQNILSDVMKHFDAQCKKHGIKYSAMKDTRNADKPNYKPSYMVFFEGRDSEVILNALRESYKDYMDYLEASKEKEKPEKGRGVFKKKQKDAPEKRESVKAKLAFFRDRVAARDKERDAVEKHRNHDNIQR